jgi:SAM-dependent methyltransferase
VAFLSKVTGHYPKFIPFLMQKLGVQFRGRILELGAGAAWFSAELSKLPKVVEVIATDFVPQPENEQSSKVFKTLQARVAKITRRPLKPHRLDFPDNHFDFVVCAGVLHNALNLLHLLREIRRILKPGGQLIAVREPVQAAVGWRPRTTARPDPEMNRPLYSRADYADTFERAGLSLEMHRVSLATGLKYYFDKMVNGLTHARYVFIAVKRAKR